MKIRDPFNSLNADKLKHVKVMLHETIRIDVF